LIKDLPYEIAFFFSLGVWVLQPVQSSDSFEIFYLYERIGEPIFTLKGKQDFMFNIPQEWLVSSNHLL